MIAILAVLVAILVPALGAARKRARALVCRSHLRPWGTTLALYLEDNEDRFVRDVTGNHPSPSLLRGFYIQREPNVSSRSHGVRTEGVACCPIGSRGQGSETLAATANSVELEVRVGSTFVPGEVIVPAPPVKMSYGLNYRLFDNGCERRGGQDWDRPYTVVPSVKGRNNIPVLLDANIYKTCLLIEMISPPPNECSTSPWINRHQGANNFLFSDWSVREAGLKEMWSLKWHLWWNTVDRWTKAGRVQPEDWPGWMRRFKDD